MPAKPHSRNIIVDLRRDCLISEGVQCRPDGKNAVFIRTEHATRRPDLGWCALVTVQLGEGDEADYAHTPLAPTVTETVQLTKQSHKTYEVRAPGMYEAHSQWTARHSKRTYVHVTQAPHGGPLAAHCFSPEVGRSMLLEKAHADRADAAGRLPPTLPPPPPAPRHGDDDTATEAIIGGSRA